MKKIMLSLALICMVTSFGFAQGSDGLSSAPHHHGHHHHHRHHVRH